MSTKIINSKFREELLEELLRESKDTSYVSCYTILNEDDSLSTRAIAYVCCARVAEYDYSGAEYILHTLHKGKEEEYKTYMDYLHERSPWKDILIRDNSLPSNVYAVRCDVPSNRMMSALIAGRHATEYPDSIRHFNKFVEEGFTEDEAMILITSSKIRGVEVLLESCITPGHLSFGSQRSTPRSTLLNFLNHKFTKGAHHYSKSGKYTFGSICPSFDSPKTTEPTFVDLLAESIGPEYFKEVQANPFHKTNATYTQIKGIPMGVFTPKVKDLFSKLREDK